MDRWRQDREGEWRHHHACREQNGSGRETVRQTAPNIISGVIYYEAAVNTMSGPCRSMLHQWSGISLPAGKSQLRKESREPKSWTSCSSRPVPRQAAMSNRWSLQSPHISPHLEHLSASAGDGDTDVGLPSSHKHNCFSLIYLCVQAQSHFHCFISLRTRVPTQSFSSAVILLIYYINVLTNINAIFTVSVLDTFLEMTVCVIFTFILNSVLFLLCECSLLHSAVPSCRCSPTWNGKLGWCKSWRQYP